jgi:hypothetical protein
VPLVEGMVIPMIQARRGRRLKLKQRIQRREFKMMDGLPGHHWRGTHDAVDICPRGRGADSELASRQVKTTRKVLTSLRAGEYAAVFVESVILKP